MGEKRFFSVGAALIAVFMLAACESTTEKAERTYAEAVELYDAGETDRAMVSLRNVFRLNGEHRDARMMFADILRERGDVEHAFRHYRLVTEQYPDDMEARVSLSRIALNLGAWDVARDQLEAAQLVDPDEPELDPLVIAVEYGTAVQDGDAGLEASALAAAQQMLEDRPEDRLLLRVVIDGLTRARRFSAALDATDQALDLYPLDAEFNQTKLNLLAQLQDLDALGEHLGVMADRFPENEEIRTALVRWYLANDDVDGAEAFVRSIVAASGDEVEPRIALVQFLTQVRGVEPALAELDRLIEEGTGADTLRLYRATLRFDIGERQTAIDEVQAMLEGREPSDETREMQTTLARMFMATGEEARARDLVDAVLEADEGQVEALKLRASWLIAEDRVRDAVLALRTALDQEPTDTEAITLLAQAHERGGNRELMAESLSRAVDASNGGADESIRYARYLVQDDKLRAAENILIQALRTAPGDVRLLQTLGQIYLQMNELPRAEQIVGALRRIDTPEAQSLATGFEAAILQRLERTDESIRLMQSMIDDGQSSLAAKTAIIRTHLANDRIDQARSFMDSLLEETGENSPDRLGVDFLNAALTASEGDLDQARTIYREILSDNPGIEAVWRALIATLTREERLTDALAVTDEAIEAVRGSANLLWIKAGLAERVGDIDDAVAIYEELYAQDSSSTIVANNLASLITTHRRDEASLERAFVIARRLRGSEVPAFQDTYGWIAHRLGNYDEALEHLEPAAQGLPNDPTVQYHLAKTYEVLDRPEEAREQYLRALTLWDDADLPLAERAREDYMAFEAALLEEAASRAIEEPDAGIGTETDGVPASE